MWTKWIYLGNVMTRYATLHNFKIFAFTKDHFLKFDFVKKIEKTNHQVISVEGTSTFVWNLKIFTFWSDARVRTHDLLISK